MADNVKSRLKKYKWPVLVLDGHGTPPYGYTINKANKTIDPNPEMLDALEVAKLFMKQGMPLREVSAWIESYTGKGYSHMGLKKRIERDNKMYAGWDKNPPVDDFPAWVSSTEDYGDGKLYYPRPVKVDLKSRRNSPTVKDKLKKAKTAEEKKVIREENQISEAKKKLNSAKTRLRKLVQKNPEVVSTFKGSQKDLWEEIVETEGLNQDGTPQEIPETKEIIFQPNEGPQTEFLASTEDVIFYGGAKGGGKSYALLADPLRYCGNGNFRALITRRTTPELRDLIRNSKNLYPKAYPGARFLKNEKVSEFPSGAAIEFGHCETDEDAERYRGNSFTWIGIDELPQYSTPAPFDSLMSCLRSTDPTLPVSMRCTGNPGNIGSAWVKEKFIDAAPSNTTFYWESKVTNPRTKETKIVRKSVKYIPATVYDNPYLLQDDSYLASLALLPEVKRKQMLEGNWDIIAEGAFPEFDRSTHVIEPFEIPSNWLTFRAADWGFKSPFCVLWFAVDFDDNIYVFHEWYDKGIYDVDWAKKIADYEISNKIYAEYGVIDGSVRSERGKMGEDSFTAINRVLRENRVARFKPADRGPGSRREGMKAVQRRLALQETGRLYDNGDPEKQPTLFIFNSCKDLIRTLPALQTDKTDPEVVAKKNSEDHAYDALQYGIRSYRSNSQKQRFTFNTVPQTHTPVDSTFGY